jgi:preprotein translocase subunit SecA
MLMQRLQVRTEEEIEREEAERQRRLQARMQLQHEAPPELSAQVPGAAPALAEGEPALAPPAGARAAPFVRGERKVGRNEPCPCGSGRKFKHCHGALQAADS